MVYAESAFLDTGLSCRVKSVGKPPKPAAAPSGTYRTIGDILMLVLIDGTQGNAALGRTQFRHGSRWVWSSEFERRRFKSD
jgi:hypothetical protein